MLGPGASLTVPSPFVSGNGYTPDDSEELAAMFAADQARAAKAAGAGAEEQEISASTLVKGSAPGMSRTSGYERARASHYQSQSWLGKHKRALSVAGLAAALLTGGGALAVQSQDSASSTAQASTPSATAVARLVRPVPVGWSRTPAWSQAAAVVSNVAVKGDLIAYLSPTGSMEIRNGDGKRVLSSAPTQFTQGTVVGIAELNDRKTAVVANQSGKVAVWVTSDMGADEASQKLNLPDGATASWGSGGLLVSSTQQAWTVDSSMRLKEIKVPDGYSAMGVLPGGDTVIAKPGDGWKIMDGSGKSRAVSSPSAPGTKGKMNVAWTSNGVMVAWGETADAAKRTVGFYDVKSGKLLASNTLSTQEVNKGLPLAVSGDGTRASAGGLLANLRSGATTHIDGWEAISSDDGALYGSVGGTNKMWDGTGQPADVEANTAIPWGALDNGHVVVVDVNATGQQSLAALERSGV